MAQELSPVTYQLTLPEQWKIHPVFHVDLLTPYQETVFHGPNYTRPPLDLIDNEEEYEVEQVLDSRVRGRNCKVQYLVKWVGYPDSNNQWVNSDQMMANNAIAEYKKRCPNTQRYIRRMKTGNLLIDFPLMSLPTPSTIENVICSNALSPHEYSLAAPLTSTDLKQVLQRFPNPTQPPDSDNSVTAPKPLTSRLDTELLTNQWWCRQLPPPPLCPTPSTCQNTHQCRQVTQRYAFPVPLEAPTVLNSTSCDAWYVACSVKNQED